MKNLFFILILSLMLGACHSRSNNTKDATGTYKGVLPCADCEGISTELILNSDSTFIKKTMYLGKDSETIIEESGTYTWDKSGKIVLKNLNDGPNKYQIGDIGLVQLDMEGNTIVGELADKYVLIKQ